MANLDARDDAFEIFHTLTDYVFPTDFLLATEFGQLRTFSIPTIAALLSRTGQYRDDGQKRLDDTKALLTSIFCAAPDSSERTEWVEHLNRIHGFYNISNDDMLYTLSVFIVDLRLWLERHGWRQLTAHEYEAVFQFYRQVGEQMRIADLPDTPAELEAWRTEYEARAQRPTPEGRETCVALLSAFRALVPRPVQPDFLAVAGSLMDAPFREATGLDSPPAWIRHPVMLAMALRARVLRHLNPWESEAFKQSDFYNQYPTYPEGYEVTTLGPRKLIRHLSNQRRDAATNSA